MRSEELGKAFPQSRVTAALVIAEQEAGWLELAAPCMAMPGCMIKPYTAFARASDGARVQSSVFLIIMNCKRSTAALPASESNI